ncbi:structural protein [Cellulophaga phage phi13:2]|uniref:Structural protein n=1 Tax=Cellulophaga phage phi13:2 TaxID=1328030 RepID=S0A2U1_9CAUD|nr:structural protein [Cellulophaga phage phi13:2]AGO49736.1 structural protein [Cellulophaga phage phi13:2]
MGKQINSPTYLEESEYNSKFDKDVSKLIDEGFSDEDIELYVQDFKKSYALKKKTFQNLLLKISNRFRDQFQKLVLRMVHKAMIHLSY